MLLVSIVSNKWFVSIKELWIQLGVGKSVPFLVIGISRSQINHCPAWYLHLQTEKSPSCLPFWEGFCEDSLLFRKPLQMLQ